MAEEKKGFFKGLWGKLVAAEPPPEQIETENTLFIAGAEPEPEPEPVEIKIPEIIVDAETEQVPLPKQPAEIPLAEPTPESYLKPSLFQRLKQGLARTHEGLVEKIDTLLLGKKQIDADMFEELEEILITADIGVPTTVELIRTLEDKLGRNELQDGAALKKALQNEIQARLERFCTPLDVSSAKPFVIMVIGVNGVGKTTTIGKLASRYKSEGRKVLLAAGDTFRAAAAEQLEEWGRRAGVDVIRHQSGADPSAVVFDGCKAAVARGCDVLIVDTAGRLHTKVNLMEEMKKIRRVMGKEIPGAPHETLLVLDAATGQNAISQTRIFKEAAEVSGVILTKLDGTAKGGIVLAVSNEFQLPIRFIGIGEQAEDLRPFEPDMFVAALFD